MLWFTELPLFLHPLKVQFSLEINVTIQIKKVLYMVLELFRLFACLHVRHKIGMALWRLQATKRMEEFAQWGAS
jgi:hypothetical protein